MLPLRKDLLLLDLAGDVASGEVGASMSKSLLVRSRIWSTNPCTCGSAYTPMAFSWLAGRLALKSSTPVKSLHPAVSRRTRCSRRPERRRLNPTTVASSYSGESCEGGGSRCRGVSIKVTLLLSTTRPVFEFHTR